MSDDLFFLPKGGSMNSIPSIIHPDLIATPWPFGGFLVPLVKPTRARTFIDVPNGPPSRFVPPRILMMPLLAKGSDLGRNRIAQESDSSRLKARRGTCGQN